MGTSEFYCKNSGGFTLIEIKVGASLVSVIALIIAQVNSVSVQSEHAGAALDEFNQTVSSLVVVVNSINVIPGTANLNRCTQAFIGMAVPNAGVPVISTALASLPPASPSSSFVSYIHSATEPVAIFEDNAAKTHPLIQVTAPTIADAAAQFPAPKNNLWVTRIYFKDWVDTNFLPAPKAHPTWVSNLYSLPIEAQTAGSVKPMMGGNVSFGKEVLLTLWTDASNTVVFCGGNPS